jgi:hypothetical protein
MSRQHRRIVTPAVAGLLLLSMVVGQIGLAHVGWDGSRSVEIPGGPPEHQPARATAAGEARMAAAAVFEGEHGLDHCYTCRWLRSLRLPLSPIGSGDFKLPEDARLHAAVFVAPDPATVESLTGRSPPRL